MFNTAKSILGVTAVSLQIVILGVNLINEIKYRKDRKDLEFRMKIEEDAFRRGYRVARDFYENEVLSQKKETE